MSRPLSNKVKMKKNKQQTIKIEFNESKFLLDVFTVVSKQQAKIRPLCRKCAHDKQAIILLYIHEIDFSIFNQLALMQ